MCLLILIFLFKNPVIKGISFLALRLYHPDKEKYQVIRKKL